jgi:hypothetical protein
LLRPLLKLFFNPNPLIQALHIQSQLNTLMGLVIETTRMGIEIKNMKMRVESLTSRLEFNERRARALESVVVYKPSSEDRIDERVQQIPAANEPESTVHEAAPVGPEGPGQRSRRRRRRRGRRGGGPAATIMGDASGTGSSSFTEQTTPTAFTAIQPRVEAPEATALPPTGGSGFAEPIEPQKPSVNMGPEGVERGAGGPDTEPNGER